MKAILDAVQRNSPRYNDFLLRGFMHEQIEGAIDFVHTMFGEAIKLFGGHIQYRGNRIMSPEKRAEYELNAYKGCRITTSDLILVEFLFAFKGVEYPVPLYIPYLRNDVIVIQDTTYVLQRTIKEQAFSRINHGVTVKVIRQPIPFYNTARHRLTSYTDDYFSPETVPTTTIHRTKRTDKGRLPNETIIHYLLCKFGFIGTLARFGLTPDDAIFTTTVGNDTAVYRYFVAKQVKKKQLPDLFLKVRIEKFANPLVVKLLASILYTLTEFPRHRVEDLYDPTGAIFRVMLGRIINGSNTNEVQSKNKIDTHIASVDTYLDPITQQRLESYGVVVADIYDLLQHVFVKIDELSRIAHTDLYNSRIDYLEELLVETIVKSVYSRWYDAIRKLGGPDIDPRQLNEKKVKHILNVRDNLITGLYNSQIVQKSPPAYGDNALVGWLIQKIRQSGVARTPRVIRSPDHRFDSSMLYVETIIAFSKANPGAAGAINPYLPITRTGGVVRLPYADEIDEIRKYLS
jgi:hypothetical protein